jgi:vacuolar-type H+-ATPase subunit E/Vma4
MGVVVETHGGAMGVENTIDSRIEAARPIWSARLREALAGEV